MKTSLWPTSGESGSADRWLRAPAPASEDKQMNSQVEMNGLIERVRGELGSCGLAGGFSERRMFGGTTFMLRGNMLCCASPRGLMLRVGKDAEAAALARPFAQLCTATGRPMPGFIQVAFAGVGDESGLAEWLARALRYVDSLPEKPGKGDEK
ncbi:TfoX/Sxy family protein [Accumulibacter sp.]|uniref:TfoX/Sxy family protein n=1 Tax=Accumulibacter sp. TaxID=2053492 RepID=UPI00262185A5|nr:TfoX/Sxy family protein [Accumulibacter sp.]